MNATEAGLSSSPLIPVAQDGDSLDELLALLTRLGGDHNPEIRLSDVLASGF